MTDANGRRTSEILRAFIDDFDGLRISVGDIRQALGDRAHGLLMFVFALPNVVPVGIPGVSTVLGLPLVLLSLQLLWNPQKTRIPRFLAVRSFDRPKFVAAMDRLLPKLARVERLLRPRLLWLTGPVAERWLGALCLGLAMILSLPIPFGNWPPALAIALLALSLVERDGFLTILGLLAALLSLAILGLFGTAFFVALEELWLSFSF